MTKVYIPVRGLRDKPPRSGPVKMIDVQIALGLAGLEVFEREDRGWGVSPTLALAMVLNQMWFGELPRDQAIERATKEEPL
jgi:hypothetical protein